METSTILSNGLPWTGILLVAVILTLGYQIALLPIYNIYFHPLRRFPGPRLWAASVLPWTFMFLSGKTHHRLAALHEQYGSVVRVAPNELSYIERRAWEDIMGRQKAGRRNENPKAPWYLSPRSKDILGASHGDHSRMRRIMAPSFSNGAMLEQPPLMKSHVDLLIQRLREKANDDKIGIDMRDWYNYATFDIIGELAMGEPFGCLRESTLHPWISLIFSNIRLTAMVLVCNRSPLLYMFFPFFVSTKLIKQFIEHQKLSRAKVAKRLADKDARPDFVQNMLSEKDGMSMSREEIDNNVVILTLAGSETTATSLTGATFLLAKHSQVMSRILGELHAAFATEDEIDLLSVSKMSYLCAVTEECLRCYPPGPNTQPRITPPEGNIILGEAIPGNTVIGIPHRAMYLSEKNFARAKEFLPERWLDESKESVFARDYKECFKPFSHGPRNCVGMNLAYAELSLIIARMIWNFDIRVAESSFDWLDRQDSYLLWDKPPLYVHLTPRESI